MERERTKHEEVFDVERSTPHGCQHLSEAITDKTKSSFRTPVLFSIGETERTGNLTMKKLCFLLLSATVVVVLPILFYGDKARIEQLRKVIPH